MKLTLALIEKLLRLSNGESIPSSQLKGDWVDDMLRDRILISTSNKSRRTYHISDKDSFIIALERVQEGLGNLDKMLSYFSTDQTVLN